MSTEVILNLIRERFSPAEGQTLVRSLQQDPLVWQFIKDKERSLQYFKTAPNNLDAFSPGNIAKWLIEQATDLSLQDLDKLDIGLPNQIKQRSEQALETVFNTELPPADLMTAGLLAITLRERRILKGSWQGISDEIWISKNRTANLKNFHVWRTPMACLFHFCPDVDALFDDFIHSKADNTLSEAIGMIVHAYFANPIENKILLDQLFTFSSLLSIDQQLMCLKWIDQFKKPELRETLAKNLIQTRNNIASFAKTFSNLEMFDSNAPNVDPLEKQISYTLPEDVNRIAAFYFYSGDQQKAAETYQKSSELLDYLKSQTQFQSLSSSTGYIPCSKWMDLIKSIPNSTQARLFYIQSLIAENNIDEAAKHLEDLPTSFEKEFLHFQINQLNGSDDDNLSKLIETSEIQSINKSNQLAGYYIHEVKLGALNKLINMNHHDELSATDLSWLDKHLEANSYDLQFIKFARDLYINADQMDKAIELSSYLELNEPEKIIHKKSLGKLYSQAERWEDAFNTIQELIKSTSAPEIEDLESFAKAALKTGHTDMAISICQNILKQAARNTKALILLGEGYLYKGDMVKAIQHMEQVVEMIPDESETWLTLAHLWQESGQTDRSLEILNKGILALPNEPDLLRALGKAHLEKQAPSDALICLKKAHEIEPKNIEGKLDLAQAEYQLGNYDHAWQLLEPYMDNYQNNPAVAKLLGHVLLAMENKQAAEPVLIHAAKSFPADVETVLATARLIIDRNATTINPTTEENFEELQTILQNALAENQNNKMLKLHLADIDRLQGQYQQALDSYIKLSEGSLNEKSGTNWRLQFGLGKTAIALGNHELGLAALQEANSKQPGNLIVSHALAEAYQAAELNTRSQETAKSTLKMAPQDINNIVWYADFKSKNNEPEEAVKALKEALEINPDRSELKLWLSKILISTGSNEESKAILTDLVQKTSASAQELHQAAYLCVQINELDLAVSALEKARQISNKTNPVLLMDLAVCYSLLDQHKKALETLNPSEDIVTLHPELALLKSDLLANLGQYSTAVKTLKSIDDTIEKEPKDNQEIIHLEHQSPLLYAYDFSLKGFFYRLGQLNRVLGNINEAQTCLQNALELDLENTKLRNAVIEAFMAGLDFEYASKFFRLNKKNEASTESFSNDHLDMECSQTEILLYQEKHEQASELFNKLTTINRTYPRVLAIQSRFAVERGDVELANEYLSEAINLFEENYGEKEFPSLEDIFRHLMTTNSIAEAAVTLNDNMKAIQKYQHAHQRLNNQPLLNWRFVLSLIRSAEFQQIAETLSIIKHAPGNEILSAENHNQSQRLLASLELYLSEEQMMCLKARCTAAFNGKWPLSLNSETCISGPEEAVAVLITSDDETLISEIMETYSNDPKVLQAYGIHALRFNKDNGVTYVEKALSQDTSNPISHALLAMLKRDDPKQALISLNTALKFWPDEPKWHELAADLHNESGNFELADHHIALALNFEPDNAIFWQKSAEIQVHENDLPKAKAHLEKSLSYSSKDPGLWIRMSDVNRRMGNVTEAIQNIQMAGEIDPEDINVAKKEIQLLIANNHFKEAEIKADDILDDNKNNDSVRTLLAQAQAKQGKFELALETLESAIKDDPQNITLRLESLIIRKDKDGAEAILPDLIKFAQTNPDDPAVLTTLTDWLIQTNRLMKAKETAQTILRILPDQAEVHLMLGRLQRKNGQLDQAITHLVDAITYDPNLVDAYIELGKTYQERRDLEQAIMTFQQGSQINASDPRPYYHAGMALKDCKDYVNAESMLRQAKKYSPDDANIIRQLGVVTALNLINNLRETR